MLGMEHTAQKSHCPPANHMLATSKNVLFPGTDDPSLLLSPLLMLGR